MNHEFVDAFSDALIEAFGCTERTAQRVARHAERHQRNSGNLHTPNEWIERLEAYDTGTLVERWRRIVDADTEITEPFSME